jgi:hypothetical protein
VAEAAKPSAPPAKRAAPRDLPKGDTPKVAAKSAAAERPAAPRAAANGEYFVQVGAYKDAATAKRVAARLREQNYPVVETVTRVGGGASPAAAPRPTPRASAPSGPDRYDVIVSGGSATDINTKLAAKGLASEPAGDAVRIRPSLPLRDAVALSKDLGNDGFKVQVRRAGTLEAAPAAPRPAPSAADNGGATLHRVRVGGYADRATARTVLRELQEKGFQPFIARERD